MIGIPTLVIGQHFLELLDQLHLKDLDVNFLTSDPDAILSILFVYDKLSIENLDVINDYVILDPCSFPFNKSFDVIFVCLPFCSEDFELQALQNIYHISGKQSLLVFSYPLGIEFNEEVEDTLQGGMAGLRLPNCPCQQTSTRFLKIPSLVVEKILSWGVATLGVEDDITFLPESDEYEILIQTNKLPSLPRCFFDEPLRLIAEPKKPIERNSTQKKNKKRKIVKESTKKLRERGVKVFQRSEMARERYPSYFDPVLIFPQLSSLSDQFEGILEEVRQVVDWVPWPENHSNDGGYQNWEIFPFLFTFPGNDPSKTVIVNSTCQKCPLLSSLLISLRPNIRTALLSRLGPDSVISAHKGWADLANYVIRWAAVFSFHNSHSLILV